MTAEGIQFTHRSETQRRQQQGSDASPDGETLFHKLTQYQQTTLPLPATGDQTGPKACQREEQPRRLIQGEMPEPCERPGKQRAPPPTAVMSGVFLAALRMRG